MKENEQIHKLIISKLDAIESQTTKTNGRVTKLEQELIGAKNEIAKALTIISGHSTVIKFYKEEMDKAREDLIEEQKEQIKKMTEEKERFNRRVLYALGMAVLFILISLGFVREDLVKLIL